MNRKDRLTKKYIGRNDVFADVVNHVCFGGEPVVRSDNLKDVSTEEWTSVRTAQGKRKSKHIYRDILKECSIKTDGESTYVIIGVENQSEIHYGMPVKVMLYDALNYDGQMKNIRDKNKTEKKLTDSAEFLSGMTKDDKIKPVTTITVYFGAEEWDGPTSLHEMFDTKNEKIISLVNDYKVNLISPQNAGDPKNYATQFGLVMKALNAAKNLDDFADILKNDDRYSRLEYDAAELIGEFSGIKIKKEENVDMGSGYINVSEHFFQKGISQGEEKFIRSALRNNKTPEQISEFNNIPLEMVLKVQKEMLAEA